MKRSTAREQYDMVLLKLIKYASLQTKVTEEDILLIMSAIDTMDKFETYVDWLKTKLDGDTLKVSAKEMVLASTLIDEGETNLP